MSGDPTYITSYNGAHSLVMKVESAMVVEELLKNVFSIIHGNDRIMRIMGLDYGTKTVGVAISDAEDHCTGIETIERKEIQSCAGLCARIEELIRNTTWRRLCLDFRST